MAVHTDHNGKVLKEGEDMDHYIEVLTSNDKLEVIKKKYPNVEYIIPNG